MQNEKLQENIFTTEFKQEKTSLDKPGVAKSISKRILTEIDFYAQKAYDDGHRTHLGASLIGNDCIRYLWYVFRWVYHYKFDGRMLRLFNRGHLEEKRFIEYLRGIGCEVFDLAADGNQIRISDCNGHFGGSLDSVIKLPLRYGIEEPLLGEFKTNGTGRGFEKLLLDGVALSKPMHFAQMSTYGYKLNFSYSLYMNVNKNDDTIHTEICKLDHKLGAYNIAKAERIIASQEPPPRLSDNPTFFTCKTCNMFEVCHKQKPVEINCRSCYYAFPSVDATWVCSNPNVGNGATIPKEVIVQGCGNHKSIV